MEEDMEIIDVENNEEPRPEANRERSRTPSVESASDNEDGQVTAKKVKLEEEEEEEKPETKEQDDDSDSELSHLCPICLDVWSNAGEHRLCSLRCGHLFGYSCVLKWLRVVCTAGNRRCPHCNKKATVKDIRILYARKLSVVDTAEIERLKKELNEVVAQKHHLETEHSKCQFRQKLYDQQLASMANRIAELERQQTDSNARPNSSASRAAECKFHLEKTLEICKNGGCRVLDYNSWHRCLAVSQKSENPLFGGFGVRKVDAEVLQQKQFILLHTHAIRDVAFHPSQETLMLSVSFDKTVKILDIRNNVVVHGYATDSQLWSGCWSSESANALLVGAQNGSIFEFDIRQTSGAVNVHAHPGDRSPVVSLAIVPANSSAGINRGGFIAAHLNTCYAYEYKDITTWTAKQMYLEGPFVSVRYDCKNHHALVSSRPNLRTPYARHTVFTIDRADSESLACNVIHTFNGGTSQQLLSRPCHINLQDDTLVALYQESSRSIPLWSVSSGKQIDRLCVVDPILDMRSFEANNSILLTALSNNKLRVYSNV